jgi:3-oxoacyl-[acyl-carrier-protein] synthase-3
MYAGIADKDHPKAGNTWLDFPTVAAADRAGVTRLRQDTKLLPDIVKLGVEEYLRLVKRERLRPEEVDHVLCHYSSHFFKGEIMKLLEQAKVAVPEHKWFSNLYTRGNTGAASIFLMLEEALHSGLFKKGETVALMVPESGRFTVSFAKLKVVDASDEAALSEASVSPVEQGGRGHHWVRSGVSSRERPAADAASVQQALAASPLGVNLDELTDALQKKVGVGLALVWADFERMLREVPIVKRLEGGDATVEDYKRLLVNLRQQVMEGARWIARAASNISIELFQFRSLFLTHAGEEHRDYQMLERDYVAVGGTLEEIQSQPKNIGSEALSGYMFHQASQPDPIDLLGAMFVIEGLGTKKAARWAEELRAHLHLTPQQTSFLTYHGKNDDDHFNKLRTTIQSGILDEKAVERIVKTAKTVARLYALQLEEVDHV